MRIASPFRAWIAFSAFIRSCRASSAAATAAASLLFARITRACRSASSWMICCAFLFANSLSTTVVVDVVELVEVGVDAGKTALAGLHSVLGNNQGKERERGKERESERKEKKRKKI